jgi:tripartite-type tricarboxylate transporter receptor subunit TctC
VIQLRMSYAGATVLASALAMPAFAQPDDDAFKGKQLTMIIGSSTGGGYDIQGRLVARHMGRHLPGNPNIVVQNMPGAGSIAAANHLYAVAPKDGTTFSLLQREVLTAKLNNPGNVRFDIEKFNWIGNIDSETGIVVAWHSSPIMTTDDLFKTEMIIGGTGPIIDTETLPRLLNTLIGTKFRIVSGYPGATEVLLAMENGEVMGIGDWSWSNIKSRNADMLEDRKIRLLMQVSLRRVADLPDVPAMAEFARNADDRQLMEVFLAQETVARPIAAPPNVPAVRVTMLRAAFMATVKDPEFLKDAERSKLDVSPSSGEEVDRVIALIGKTPKALTDRMLAAIAPPK